MSVSFGDQLPVDAVVWYELQKPQQFKSVWWPSKVVSTSVDSLEVETFGDHCVYKVNDTAKLKLFNFPNYFQLLSIGQKKFKKRKSAMSDYRDAVKQGINHYRSHHDDPTFDLDFECDSSDLSVLATPENVGRITFEESFFTTGDCTTLDDSYTHSPELTSSPEKQAKKQKLFSEAGNGTDIFGDPVTCHSEGTSSPAVNNKKKKQNCPRSRVPDVSPRQNGANARERDETVTSRDSQADQKHKRSLRQLSDCSVTTDPLLTSGMVESSPETSTSKKFKRLLEFAPSSTPNKLRVKKRRPRSKAAKAWEKKSKVMNTKPISDEVTSSNGASEEVDEESVEIETSRVSKALLKESLATSFQADVASSMSLVEEIIGQSSEDSDGERESEESDDDLPTFIFSVEENVKLHELVPNDIVWVQYRRFPYWPALVIRAPKRKNKSNKIYVKFFGYNDSNSPSIRIAREKKVARFSKHSQRAKQFMEEGRNNENKDMFSQAVEDAESLAFLRSTGEISGTPDEQYQEIINRRPTNHVVKKSPMVVGLLTKRITSISWTDPSIDSMNFDSDSDDESVDIPSSEGEEDNEHYKYNYLKVMKLITSIKTYLIEIMRGNTSSRRHTIFTKGSEKEKYALKRQETFGPLKWTSSKRVKFGSDLTSLIESIDAHLPKETLTQDYLLSVLMPEAIIQVMMIVDGNTYEQADEIFSNL